MAGHGPASRRARIALVAVVALGLLAGCTGLETLGGGHPAGDPASDRIGWENGYWYDDPVNVTASDGYNASEREAVVARTMARVEAIRDLEFNSTVPVDVISREQYLANRSGGGGNRTYSRWNDQVWESIFVVGERSSYSNSSSETLGQSVQGYYSPGEDAIVLVSDSQTPTIDRTTLAHELVHALQDQHFGFGADGDTQDQQLANRGVTEGDARYVDALYENRCEGRWSCIPKPDAGGGGGGGSASDDYNRGLFLTIYTPYAAGSQFVDRVRAQSGWDGVNEVYDARPESTEQLIHPELYPDEEPVNVTVPDRSNGEWRRFDVESVTDTVGEASIYAMLVHNGAVDPENRYGYESQPSAGWGGDSVVPYTNGTTGAYVWETAWDSDRDAEQFHTAYLDVLDYHDARNPRGNVYVVPDGEFADAFRVVRTGDTVRIVNAPTVDGLDAVHSRSG